LFSLYCDKDGFYLFLYVVVKVGLQPKGNYLAQTFKKIEDGVAMKTDKGPKDDSQNY